MESFNEYLMSDISLNINVQLHQLSSNLANVFHSIRTSPNMSTSTEIYAAVVSHYSAASSNRSKTGAYESTVAKAFGYSEAELASIPQESNLGLSCGNPLVLAALRPGETVIDLGSGAGFDVFLAAQNIGDHGKAIGVDMNDDMLAQAEKNKRSANKGAGAPNVSFVKAPITDISPLGDGVADCIISNCVVNLVPEAEKPLVFQEMFRLLKSGGRVAISDILIKDGKQLPDSLKQDMGLYVGCIAGASLISGYQNYLKDAGFSEVLIIDNNKDLNVYNAQDDSSEGKSCCGTTMPAESVKAKSCCGTTVPAEPVKAKSCCGTSVSQGQSNGVPKESQNGPTAVAVDLSSVDFNAYAGSYNIYAVKA